MGRKRNWPPKRHTKGGRERVFWNGTWHYLGPAGSAEAKAKYGSLILLWAEDPNALAMSEDDLLVPTLCADFLESTTAPTDHRQRDQVKRAISLLLEHHLNTAVNDFGPIALATWQAWLCRQEHLPPLQNAFQRKWNRTTIRHFVRWIKAVWKWGVATERVTEDRYRALLTVPGPKFEECREPEEVFGAIAEHVAAIVPFLREPVRTMLLLQRATGARPGEIFVMRPCDVHTRGRVRIPRTGAMFDVDAEKVWIYIPDRHKGKSRWKPRALYFAAAEKELLRPYLDRAAEAYCFDPREAMASLRAEQKAARLRRGGGSGGSRKKLVAVPQREPAAMYNRAAYYHAIQRACDLAGVPRFSAYQIRHLVGEEVYCDHDLDAARDVLGHSDPRTTVRYAKMSAKRAAAVARQRGGVA
jgi:integrase